MGGDFFSVAGCLTIGLMQAEGRGKILVPRGYSEAERTGKVTLHIVQVGETEKR